MQENTEEITSLVSEIEQALISFKELLADTPVNDVVNSSFKRSKRAFEELAEALGEDNPTRTIECSKTVAESTRTIALLAPTLDDAEYEDAKEELLESARSLLNIVREPPAPLRPIDPIEIKSVFTAGDVVTNRNGKGLLSTREQEKHYQRFKKTLNENDFRIANLEQKLNDLEKTASTEIDKITALYSVALHEIEGKKTEIDNILGHVSGRTVAGDYEKSATEEKNKADWLRIGSLLCMALIAVSLGYSFWETIGTEFDWQKSLFRITLTFLLSVPAAYLARESAKHREQQYQHLQTSLDLKAISPFLASLPEEEQHKIKIAIASKLFAGRDFSKTSADPFPLNTQEIIMELLKRLDLSKVQASKD
ncbi:hypothetical protein ABHN98_01640 [Pseudomonas syringae]